MARPPDSSGRPVCVVIAGPNGAGKSTVAPELLREAVGIAAFVNADVIAQGLSGFDPGAAAVQAGRVMLERLQLLARDRTSFAFESTLSGRSLLGFLTHLADTGYEVDIHYLWLESAELAAARVASRVAAGGHDVPRHDISRRFGRSVTNFWIRYRLVASRWRVYDGGTWGTPLVAFGAGTAIHAIADGDRFRRFLAVAGAVR